jgi:putative hydrolase of the HAD superfamily
LGFPKEHADFWRLLQQRIPFEKQTSLLIDDSLAVLNSAKQFGIAHLIAVSKPDTKLPKREIAGYAAIEDFRELILGL